MERQLRSGGRLADAASVVAGAAPALAMPGAGWWWAAWVCLGPWLLLVASAPTARRAALRGWLGGAGFVLAVHHWLLPSVHVFLPVVALVVGALWAPWGALARSALRRAGTWGVLGAAVVVPAGWVLVELARSWDALGGPWGLVGATQWPVPDVLALASLGGVWLVSWLVVCVNVLVVLLLREPRTTGPAVAGALVTLAAVTGAWSQWGWHPEPAGEVRVAAVQPGRTATGEARVDAGVRLTSELGSRLADDPVDLVVWAESSVPMDLGSEPGLVQRLGRVSTDAGAPLLVNVDALRPGGEGIFKTSVLLDASGVKADYDKTRLVPFGEYLPARGLLEPLVGWTEAAAVDRRVGDGPVVMRVAGTGGVDGLDVGPLICFESAFPDMTRELVRRGADIVVVQASTATFQGSWAQDQHAALASVRAVESGRPVVHATLTGVTAAVDARGRQVGERLGPERSQAVVYDIPLSSGRTPYVAIGDYVPLLAAVAVGLAVAGRLVRLRPPWRSSASTSGSSGAEKAQRP